MDDVFVKVCTRCGIKKPLDDFYKPKHAARRAECRACQSAYAKKYRTAKADYFREWRENRRETADYARAWHLQNRYGISLEAYEEIALTQNHVCAICSRPNRTRKNLVVDHDHETGQIRGLLCDPCNTAIGVLGDTSDGVQRAVEYLKRGAIERPDHSTRAEGREAGLRA